MRRMREKVGLCRRDCREALDRYSRRAIRLERIAFAFVFAEQIVDQAGEEDPKQIDGYLSNVDLISNGSHGEPPLIGQ